MNLASIVWALASLLGRSSSVVASFTVVVVDHFGLPDPDEARSCPGQAAILSAPKGRVLVKASGPYRVFPDHSGFDAANRCWPMFNRLLDRLGPQNMMWGSDWPWTRFEDKYSFADTLAWRDLWTTYAACPAAAS